MARQLSLGLALLCLLFLLTSQSGDSLSLFDPLVGRASGRSLDSIFGRPRFLQSIDEGVTPVATNASSIVSSTDDEACAQPSCDITSKIGSAELGRDVSQREWCASVMRGCGFVMTHLCPAETALASGEGGLKNRLLVMLSSVTGSCQQCVNSLAQMGCKECSCVGYSGVQAAKTALNCCAR